MVRENFEAGKGNKDYEEKFKHTHDNKEISGAQQENDRKDAQNENNIRECGEDHKQNGGSKKELSEEKSETEKTESPEEEAIKAANSCETGHEQGTEAAENGDEKEEEGGLQEEETVESLKEELAQSRAKNEETIDLLQRVKADYDNYRRRAASEKEEAKKYALYDFMSELIPVIDNLERALQASKGENVPQSHIDGLQMIYNQLIQLMEKQGVLPIKAEGKVFDPCYHQAVMQSHEKGYAPNTVVEEMQKGYIMKDRVLRPSMVKVAMGEEAGSCEQENEEPQNSNRKENGEEEEEEK